MVNSDLISVVPVLTHVLGKAQTCW